MKPRNGPDLGQWESSTAQKTSPLSMEVFIWVGGEVFQVAFVKYNIVKHMTE